MHVRIFKFFIFTIVLSLIFSQSTSAYELNYQFIDETGELTNLNRYSGEYLFVDTFATWCESCRLSMVHLLELFDLVGDQMVMISLSVEPKDTVEKINEYKQEFEAPWDFGLDYQSQFLHSYPVNEYPTHYFFGPDGKVLRSWVGITEPAKFLNDIDDFIEIPEDYKPQRDSGIYTDQIFSNPMFIVTSAIFVFIIAYNFTRRTKNAVNIQS